MVSHEQFGIEKLLTNERQNLAWRFVVRKKQADVRVESEMYLDYPRIAFSENHLLITDQSPLSDCCDNCNSFTNLVRKQITYYAIKANIRVVDCEREKNLRRNFENVIGKSVSTFEATAYNVDGASKELN